MTNRAVFKPPNPDIVTVEGQVSNYDLSGEYIVQAAEQRMVDVTAFQSPTPQAIRGELELTLIRCGSLKSVDTIDLAKRNMVHGLLNEDDPDARAALAALWRLDRELPSDQEAIVEVSATNGKPVFKVGIRNRKDANE